MSDYLLNDDDYCDEISGNDFSFLSVCCGSPAIGETSDCGDGERIGLCRTCRDHATFTIVENDSDENPLDD